MRKKTGLTSGIDAILEKVETKNKKKDGYFRKFRLTRFLEKFVVIVGFSIIVGATGEAFGQSTTEADNLETALNSPELNDAIDSYMLGDYEKCYEKFKAAHEANDQYPPPGILLARLFSDRGQLVSMRTYLEKTVDDYPNDPEAFLQLAGVALQEQRLVEAALLIERAVAILENFKKSRTTDLNKSDDRLSYLIDDSLSLQANLAQRKGDLAKSREWVEKLIALRPNNDAAFVSLGYLCFESNQTDEALKAFDKANKLNPAERLPGWLVLALLLEQKEKIEESQQFVEENFNAETASPRQYYNVVQLYMKWDKLEKALALAEDYRIRFPNTLESWILLGQISLYYHQYKAAEDYFRKAILISPLHFEANDGMALALCDQGSRVKLNQAVQTAYANWDRNNSSDEAVATYAWTLFLNGRKDDADMIFSPFIQRGQMTPTVAYYLAEIAHSKGDSSLALNFIDLALNQRVNFPKKAAAQELREIISPQNADSKEDNGDKPDEKPEKSE